MQDDSEEGTLLRRGTKRLAIEFSGPWSRDRVGWKKIADGSEVVILLLCSSKSLRIVTGSKMSFHDLDFTRVRTHKKGIVTGVTLVLGET